MNIFTRNIRSAVLKAVTKNGLQLANVNGKFQEDKQIVSIAIKQNVKAGEFIGKNLSRDEQFIYALAKDNVEVLRYLHNDTATKVLQKLREESKNRAEKYISSSKVFDDKMVIDSIDKIKWALNFTSGAVALERATDEMKDDFEAVLICVTNKGQALYHASKRLQNNNQIVYEAVKEDGLSLMSASERLQDNDKIVRIALENNGYALRFASDRLKKNKGMVRLACQNQPWAIMYASTELRNDVDFIYSLALDNRQVMSKVPKKVYEKVMRKLMQNGLWEDRAQASEETERV